MSHTIEAPIFNLGDWKCECGHDVGYCRGVLLLLGSGVVFKSDGVGDYADTEGVVSPFGFYGLAHHGTEIVCPGFGGGE